MDKIITTRDCIVSPIDTNEFMKITEISKDENMQYHYYATIVENGFSQKIIKLYDAFDESTDTYNKFEIEEEISKYQLQLRENDIKIFRLEWNDNRVSFYTKYPTLHGFMKDYKKLMSRDVYMTFGYTKDNLESLVATISKVCNTHLYDDLKEENLIQTGREKFYISIRPVKQDKYYSIISCNVAQGANFQEKLEKAKSLETKIMSINGVELIEFDIFTDGEIYYKP